MQTIKIMQGDSFAVFLNLKINNVVMTPDNIQDLEITVGESLRKLYSAGGAKYDTSLRKWFFIPTQEETLSLEPNAYDVQARAKFLNGQYSSVKGVVVGKIIILSANSKEVI